jgi:thiol-disulfide isomerase/thioredoxin
MAVRRVRRTRTRRLVQLAKPRVTAINSKKAWEDLLRKADGRTLVIMFGGEKSLMCLRYEPVFAELSKRKEYSQFMFAKVDVEKLKGVKTMVDTSTIKQLPTFMCFRDGRLLETCEATSPAAVKQMLQRVSQTSGLVRMLSNIGKFAVKCVSLPLKPVGVVLRPKLWKVLVASPLFVLAFLQLQESQARKKMAEKKTELKKVDDFNDLVKKVGFKRAKQMQRNRWLVKTVRQMKQFESGVAIKNIKSTFKDLDYASHTVGGGQGSLLSNSRAGVGEEMAHRWSENVSRGKVFPSKYLRHPTFVAENQNRERQLQWIQEVKLRYKAFNEATIQRWKDDVKDALCLKSNNLSEMPEIDWARLEFAEISVKDFKKELLLRTGFSYDKECMDKEAYEQAWVDYLSKLKKDTAKKLTRARKPSPLSVYDFSRTSLFQGSRNRVFLGTDIPRAYFWK